MRTTTWMAALALFATPAMAQRVAPVGGNAKRDTAQGPTWRADQLAVLAGTVTDSTGRPVPFASILPDTGSGTLAQADGSFRLAPLAPGPHGFLIRRIGYQPLAFEMEMPPGATVNVQLKLLPASLELKPVVVEGKRVSPALAKTGFYDRQRQGLAGYFIDPEVFEKRTMVATTDVLRGVPNITVSKDGTEYHVYGRGQRCMEIYVDGAPMGRDFDLTRHMPPAWVKAIEIYPSPNQTPPQFSRQTGCGAVVVWTKVD
ncbi:MAG: TonB-dependent receptor [Gemmatimonadetes bacterium]|nr:TonB-dependent receptor [Gemmatimonadota bacterium]